MKYRVDVRLTGYIDLEADSEDEAREQAEDGFSIYKFNCEDIEIDDISPLK